LKDKYQLTAVAYATKHVPILKLFNCKDESVKQQAFVYAASNGVLDIFEFMLTDNNYSTVDINGIDSTHGETGKLIEKQKERNELIIYYVDSFNKCSKSWSYKYN
jgi:hypothetical protein